MKNKQKKGTNVFVSLSNDSTYEMFVSHWEQILDQTNSREQRDASFSTIRAILVNTRKSKERVQKQKSNRKTEGLLYVCQKAGELEKKILRVVETAEKCAGLTKTYSQALLPVVVFHPSDEESFGEN